MGDVRITRCKKLAGLRISDLIDLLRDQGKGDYLPPLNSKGKEPAYDRQWLLFVSITAFLSVISAHKHFTAHRIRGDETEEL